MIYYGNVKIMLHFQLLEYMFNRIKNTMAFVIFWLLLSNPFYGSYIYDSHLF